MSNAQSSAGTSAGGASGGHGHASTGHGDDMNIFKIVVVGVVSLVIFGLSAVVAAVILNSDETERNKTGIAPMPADIRHKEEIGIIDYVPFDNDHRLETWQAKQHDALTSYGWVDRGKGVVHIPIDEAIKDVIQHAAGGGSNK